MKFQELVILLPCHSLEDFPTHHSGDEAEGLLSAWSSLWHPALLASARSVPNWARADAPPENIAGKLLVCPQVAQELLLAGFAGRCKNDGAVLIRKCTTRQQILEKALAELDGGAGGVSDDLAADFLALGYCRIQVDLLTRHMRYSTSIDETYFQDEVLAAADGALRGDEETARSHLALCYEVLNEARKHYYPVDAYLVDLTLVASTTMGAALRRDLQTLLDRTAVTPLGHVRPMNVMLTAETLREMAQREPESLSLLRRAVEGGLASIVGGEDTEREWPLLPIESLRGSVAHAIDDFQRLLGTRPKVYGRRRYGLTHMLPQVLSKFGFVGALHFTLDDGRFPTGHQSKGRWEGVDGSSIDVIMKVPQDAAQPETFLEMARKLGESIDTDHVATTVFAHWPGQASEWYDDLRRISSYAPALGRFVTLDYYFAETDNAGNLTRFDPDEYRSPYFKQAIIRRQPDALSSVARQHGLRAQQDAARTISSLAELIKPGVANENLPWGRREHDAQDDAVALEATQVSAQPPNDPGEEASAAGMSIASTQAMLDQAISAFSDALPRSTKPAAPGYLVMNPLSFTRRIGIELPQLTGPPDAAAPVHAAGLIAGRPAAVIEVPPLGFAWVTAGTAKAGKPPKAMVEDNILRNEFVELVISQSSGGIQSIHDFKHRSNRLSQQIALRLPVGRPAPGEMWRDPDEDAAYSTMVAEAIEVTSAGPPFGEIVTRGSLLNADNKPVGKFRQATRLWLGSRVIELKIEIDPLEDLRADPWNSYYAARFAWPDSDAELYRSAGLGRFRTQAKRIEAPHFVEIEMERGRTAILTAGLPYQRRSGLRMLDALLLARGETNRTFTLGIGVDLAHPSLAATELLTPVAARFETRSAPTAASSWLFHIDARNVLATHWEPLVLSGDGDSNASQATAETTSITGTHGFCTRILETEGKAGRVTLRALRPLSAARQIDFQGQPLQELPIEGDKIILNIAAHEWIQVEARWK